jgi:hypothetical protein
LLHQLFDEQKDVSLLHFIKREHSDLRLTLEKIATESKADAKLLEEFAKSDPSIRLDDIQLPPGETATRAAIAATKKEEILRHSGDSLELTLILAQAEALSYAWHLAQVASENEPQPEHSQALARMGEEMKVLYQEVLMMLRSEQKPSSDGK